MASGSISWIQHGETISGQGDPSDVLNRPLRNVLAASGYQSDGSDFAGFAPLSASVTVQSGSFIIVSGSASGTIATTMYLTGSAVGLTGSVIAQNLIQSGTFSFVTGSTIRITGSVTNLTGSTFVTGTVTNVSNGTMTGTVTNFTGSASGTVTTGTGNFTGSITSFTGSASGVITNHTGSASGSFSSATGSFSGTATNFSGTMTGSATTATGSFLGTVTNFFANAISGATGSFSGSLSVFSGSVISATVLSSTGSFSGSVTNFTGSITNQAFTSSFFISGSGLTLVTSSVDTVAQGIPTGSTVYNLSTQRIERKVTGGYVKLTDTPIDTVNPYTFALPGWQVGTGQIIFITQAEINANPQWKGTYFAGLDTQDYVCIQEAIYNAYAAQSQTGSIIWGSQHPIYIPAGAYWVSRPLWIAQTQGAQIRGGGQLGTYISQMSSDAQVLKTDGFAYSSIRDMAFQGANSYRHVTPHAHFHKATVDFDCMGNNGIIGGPPNQTCDMTPRTIISSSMPYLRRANSNWAINQWAGKYVAIIDDYPNSWAVGELRRIIENTADTLYIAGDWDFTWNIGTGSAPSSTACKFVLDPLVANWSNFHDLSHTIDFTTDFTNLSGSVSPDGKILRKFNYRHQNGTGSQAVTIISHTKRSLYHTAYSASIFQYLDYGAGGPYPNTGSLQAALQLASSNGLASVPTEQPSCNYVIGGTYYDATNDGQDHTIYASSDNWVTFSGSFGVNDKVGAYIQLISSSQGMAPTAITSEVGGFGPTGDWSILTINGLNRTPNGDVGKYLSVCQLGGGATDSRLYQNRLILSNTTSSFTLDQAIGLGTGDVVQIVDPALGQIYPICQNSGSIIYTTYAPGGGTYQKHYWSRRPKAGDVFNLQGRNTNQLVHQNNFNNISIGGTAADLGWAWCRSGDGGMGSETSWHDCTLGATRVCFFGNGYNMIDCHWHGGGAGAMVYGFYIPRGTMNFYGIGFGTQMGTQQGHDIVLADGQAAHNVLSAVYSESRLMVSSGAPVVMLNPRHASGIDIGGLDGAYVGTGAFNRTWSPGEYWTPPAPWHKGRQFICVAIIGNGSTAQATMPSSSVAEGYDPRVQFVGPDGNGAAFIRSDVLTWAGSSDMYIMGGTLSAGMLKNYGNSTVFGTQFSRPDWRGLGNYAIGAGVNAIGAKVRPSFMDGNNWFGGDPPSLAFYGSTPTDYEQPLHPTIISNPIFMPLSWYGQLVQMGFMPFLHQDPGWANGRWNYHLMSFLDNGSATRAGESVVFGKRPRSGSDVVGVDMVIAGGQSTGQAVGGGLRFQVAVPSGSSGLLVNDLTDAVAIDGNKRTKFYGRRIDNIIIPPNGTTSIDVSNGNYVVLSNSGSTTVDHFTILTGSLEDGHTLYTEFTNTNTMITSSGNIKLLSGATGKTGSVDLMSIFIYRAGTWREII